MGTEIRPLDYSMQLLKKLIGGDKIVSRQMNRWIGQFQYTPLN